MSNWYLGNIHCHTTNSDGKNSPEFVANFYKNAGFHFVSITDHNHLTFLHETKIENDGSFIAIQGIEFTTAAQQKPYAGSKPNSQTHINGIGISKEFKPDKDYKTVEEALQHGINLIKEQNGFAIINHPNWLWAIQSKNLLQVQKMDAFEVFNGAFTSNNYGYDGLESTDEMWDKVLSTGKLLYGVASDDCHVFPKTLQTKDAPFSGFIGVEAESLTAENILAALKAGRFYASTRVQLENFSCDGKSYKVNIKPEGEVLFLTKFIGKNGRILDVQKGLNAEYKIRGNESYVRAIVQNTDNFLAWTQPYMLNQKF